MFHARAGLSPTGFAWFRMGWVLSRQPSCQFIHIGGMVYPPIELCICGGEELVLGWFKGFRDVSVDESYFVSPILVVC